MKLLIILPSQARGGAEEHALTIARGSIAHGWTVEAAFPNATSLQGLVQEMQADNIHYRPLEIGETIVLPASTLSELISTLPRRLQTWIEKPIHLIRGVGCLWRSRPDVVMIGVPWAEQCLTSLLACALLRQPTLTVFHCIPWRFDLPTWKLNLYHWIRDRNQTWMTISESYRQFIGETFHCPVDQVVRIYNGIDIQAMDLPSQAPSQEQDLRQDLRQELGLPTGSRILLTVARLDGHKGHDDLIPTLPHLLKQFPDIHCVWVGEGDCKAALAHQLNTYGVQSAVSMLGYRKDVPKLLQAADLFVFPTRFDGFPFALLEAMAYGVPIIATAINGIPEMLEDGVHGKLCRVSDSCDLLETLRWALQHPDTLQTMAKQASKQVSRFSKATMIQETLSLLEKIGHTSYG